MPHEPYTSLVYPDVEGWLSDQEGYLLAHLAERKICLEIGSHKGRSALWIMQGAKHLYCVDPFEQYDEFVKNLKRYDVRIEHQRLPQRAVIPIKGKSPWALKNVSELIDFAFIDGGHAEHEVWADIEGVMQVIASPGLIAFHDYERPGDAGVTAAVNRFIQAGATLCYTVGTVAVLEPPLLAGWNKTDLPPVTEVNVKPLEG
jgi:predicted O-methyltransferase YrrM